MTGSPVGVLALQGDVGHHRSTLARLGVETLAVRRPEHLAAVDSLILPGGESTTLSLLLDSSGLFDPLSERLATGMPVFGTCAGMILLATEVLDGRPDQRTFARIDLAVRRNGFGRQTASFEAPVHVAGWDRPFDGVFIRAPLVERVGPGVEVLATIEGPDGVDRAVLCRDGAVLVSAFHPELSDDSRIHEYFLTLRDEARAVS